MFCCSDRAKYRHFDAQDENELLSSSPHLIHSWLDVVCIRFCAIRSSNVRVLLIIHLTHGGGGSIWIRIRVDIAIGL